MLEMLHRDAEEQSVKRIGNRVLVVEDDEATAYALRDGLEYEGYSVLVATDGQRAVRLVEEEHPDLILLDVMLPEMSGLDVCKQIRSNSNDVPIIMLTARGQEVDKVLGLKLGADDYVTKPFSFMELMARVEAVLRRTSARADLANAYEFGDVRLDFRTLVAARHLRAKKSGFLAAISFLAIMAVSATWARSNSAFTPSMSTLTLPSPWARA